MSLSFEVIAVPPQTLRRNPSPSASTRALQTLLLVAATVFFTLHFLHLAADFPNHSPWMDWAKYTDEGWYGDAAIRHFLLGRWNLPGDFNPAAALPVWPLLEVAVFRLAGVGIVPARALAVSIFGLTLLCSWLLLRRLSPVTGRTPLAPPVAVLLLAVSPFCYAFSRMAILEPLLILLMVLALLSASLVQRAPASRARQLLPLLALAVLLPLMVLTKTTALFLLPSLAWLLWARLGYRWRPLLRQGGAAALLGASLWLLYYGVLVRPHFLTDYRYLFSANAYTGITRHNFFGVLVSTLRDGLWIGRILYPLALALAAVALFRLRRLRENPLAISLMLWAAGYAAFLTYHNNLQPRYYLVVAVPLTLLVPVVLEDLWTHTTVPAAQAAVLAGAGLLVAIVLSDAAQTLAFVRSPQYTFLHAAQGIRNIIAADPAHNRLLLSISGSDLSLMTGLPSICDDFGTMELDQRIATYHPGWYAAWNQVDDDKMDALTPAYHLERVAAFPAMDDPDRNLLILYRLDPAIGRRSHHRRRPTPPLLRTRIGQQPSTSQLQH